jgi:hypothetical protein
MITRMRFPAGHSKNSRQRADLQKEDVCELKVVLSGSDPPVWRRIQVLGGYSLAELHRVLQRVMGWQDCHLHEFVVGNTRYGQSARQDGFSVSRVQDESRAVLSDLLPMVGKSFRYVYDFGDDWMHEIKVEKIFLPEAGASYPLCVAGENACPPEDSGGIYGYHEKLEILKDAGRPDHEDVKERMGQFDPSYFNLEAANHSLRALSTKRA